MMMMVLVITCLLNHYRLSAQSLISRHGRVRRRHLPLPSVYAPRPPDPQRERLSRFQPTFPYLPHAVIDLPPTISLSDGEEPPPYLGPCSLQLRDPEQQLELNRESVRAPPNRTVFDSPLIPAEGAPPAYSEVIGHCDPPSSPLVQGLTDGRNTHNRDKPKAQHV
ncbi:protein TMEPAI isoform X2 [Carassius gibelio]|nr:protein TMEPAI isoform X2 [Carassius gibelio]